MNTTPELALTVALIALVGVLVNTFVTVYNARKRRNLDEKLLRLKSELDQLNACEMIRVQTEHTERLKVLEFEHKKELSDDEKKRKVDAEIFSSIIELLEPQGVIAFLREHDFGGTFKLEDIAPLNSFINLSSAPNQEFLFTDLEKMRIQMMSKAKTLSKLIGLKTFSRKPGFNSVLSKEYVNESRPEFINQNAADINESATEFVFIFDNFVKQCRIKL